MESTTSPEILRATPRARSLLSALVLLVLAFFVACQFVALPYLKAALTTAPPSNQPVIRTMLIGFASIATLIGLWTILYGRKIIRRGEYPPANAWVWCDTVIKHGRAATQFGLAHIVSGLLMCIIGIGAPLYLWHRIFQSTLAFQPGNGIIILQQKTKPHP
jgi:uncharacterized protein YneF (UPF0154 family)